MSGGAGNPLAQALALHRSGDLAAAEALYRRILDRSPKDPDALHLLGVLHHQTGRSADAVALIGKAIRAKGAVAEFHSNFALALQAVGRAGEAVRHFEEAVRLRADYWEAHFNLGLLRQGLGRLDGALAHLRRAVELRPPDPAPYGALATLLSAVGRVGEGIAYHQAALALRPEDPALIGTLAGAFREAGMIEHAADAYAEALRRDPRNPRFLNDFGLVMQALGRRDDAANCFEAALGIDPAFAEAEDNLGSLALLAGRAGEAADRHRSALRHRPALAAAWNNLGNALKALGRLDEAVRAWRTALALFPNGAEVWTNLGNGHRAAERFAESETAHRRALRLRPGSPIAHNNLGDAIQLHGGDAVGARHYRLALTIDPAYAEAASNLALALQRLGGVEDARAWFDRALALVPDLALARFNRGLLRLERGEFAEGWPDYAWRFGSGRVGRGRQPGPPAWRGEELAGKRLLVWREQGVGDELLFASCYPDAIARARHVVVECDPRLVTLFQRSFPAATVRAQAIDAEGRETRLVPDCDLHAPAGTLARVFRTRLAAFSHSSAWIVPDPDRVAGWRDRLARLPPGLRVGIAWRSQLVTAERRTAYTTLDQWAPVFATPGVTLVNLQYGEVEAELAVTEQRFGVAIHRWPDLDLRDDFEASAALTASLDLVIAPAVSAGELAGAVGTPTWRIGGPDWTWLGSGVRPWFPSMRVVAPPPGGSPGDALGRIAADLRELRQALPFRCIMLP